MLVISAMRPRLSGNVRRRRKMKLVFPGRNERGDEALVEILRAEIAAAGGWIPFDRFMLQCLQHPERGYYRRGRTRAGHGGDFLTAPEAHPAFGGALARQLEELEGALGRGAPPDAEPA